MRVVMHPQAFEKELNVILANKLDESASVIEVNAEDEAPVQTGALRDSIRKEVDKDTLEAEIGSDLDYALYIELGGRNNPPNAFLRRALGKSTQAIKAIFSRK